jgi:LPS-assembly protein
VSQDQYPSFDLIDRIPETNLLTYSISTQLVSRSERKGTEEQNLNDTLSNISYRQFFQLELKQQYDINKANHDESEPFSPIYTRLSFTPSEYLTLDIESQWSIYQDEFVSRNATMNILDHRGDRLFVEYRYANEDIKINPVESVNVVTDVNLFNGFSVYGSYEHNIFTDEKIKQEIGILYQGQCWQMDVRYWEENNNYKIRLSFKLKGLGDIDS